MAWAEERAPGDDSYTTWDCAAYIERVGGEEEAERRRTALMGRQGDQQLADSHASDTVEPDPLL